MCVIRALDPGKPKKVCISCLRVSRWKFHKGLINFFEQAIETSIWISLESTDTWMLYHIPDGNDLHGCVNHNESVKYIYMQANARKD
jgi:hypothetical protein